MSTGQDFDPWLTATAVNELSIELHYTVPDLCNLIKQLITDNVPVPVKISHILRSTAKTKTMLDYIKERSDKASVFICMMACKQFREAAQEDRVNRVLVEARANYAEILAILLIAEHDERDRLSEALTAEFDDSRSLRKPMQNALTLAVDAKATYFVSDARVHETLKAIWRGDLVFSSEVLESLQRRYGMRRARQIERQFEREEGPRGRRRLKITLDNLKVPRYQYYTAVTIYFAFLVVYSVVVNGRRTDEPSPWEILMYILALSFMAEDLKTVMLAHRKFASLGMWNWIDWLSYILFAVAFGYRMAGVWSRIPDRRQAYADKSYNLLSCVAALIWSRTLEMLDTFREFGYLLVTVRRMMKDALHFFLLIAVLVVGFGQGFMALSRTFDAMGIQTEGQDIGVPFVLNMLAQALFQVPDYSFAEMIHPVYGTILLHMFMFITFMIFVNLLIAVFNHSYDQVRSRSEAEFQLLFSEKILEHVQRSREVPFLPPANLIEMFLYPFTFLIPRRYRHNVLFHICSICFIPEMLAVALYEFLFPPLVAGRLKNLSGHGLAFETWRIDMEVGDVSGGTEGAGGRTGDNVDQAVSKAVDPQKRVNRGGQQWVSQGMEMELVERLDKMETTLSMVGRQMEEERKRWGEEKESMAQRIAELVLQKAGR
ncbi:hypothetical protein HDV00_001116 [Rhizophlyctis rosea]|nr:hypothetical protein HDV00_001116 [Rhizophlyctis rosea]